MVLTSEAGLAPADGRVGYPLCGPGRAGSDRLAGPPSTTTRCCVSLEAAEFSAACLLLLAVEASTSGLARTRRGGRAPPAERAGVAGVASRPTASWLPAAAMPPCRAHAGPPPFGIHYNVHKSYHLQRLAASLAEEDGAGRGPRSTLCLGRGGSQGQAGKHARGGGCCPPRPARWSLLVAPRAESAERQPGDVPSAWRGAPRILTKRRKSIGQNPGNLAALSYGETSSRPWPFRTEPSSGPPLESHR